MANTPYVTTDVLHSVSTPNPIIGSATDQVGFYGATGVVGSTNLTGATAGNQLASLVATQLILANLGLVVIK